MKMIILRLVWLHVAVTASEYAGCDLHIKTTVTVLWFMMATIQDHCSWQLPCTRVKCKIKQVWVNVTSHSFSELLGIFSTW